MSSFRVEAEIAADGSRFGAALLQAERKLEHFQEKLNHTGEHHLGSTFATLFGFAAIEMATHKTIEYGAHIFDLSRRLDVSREDLQKWDYALTQNGSSLDAAAGFFEKLAMARRKALSGSDEEIESFKQLGVSIDDLKTKNLQTIGLQIGESVKEGDAQKLIAALRGVGGKAAGELVAAFKAGLPEAFHEAEHLGLIIKDETVVSLKQAEDEIANMAKAFRSFLAPAIAFVTHQITQMLDFLKLVAKVTGAGFGALSAGEGIKGITKATGDAANEVIDERIKREAETKKKASEHGGEGLGGDDETKNTKEAEKQLKLREKLEEITRRNNLNSLSASERLNALEKERADILAQGPPSLEQNIKAEEIRGEIIQLKKGKQLQPEADSLAKIGGFVGNAASQNPILNVAQEQLKVQRKIERNTSKTEADGGEEF